MRDASPAIAGRMGKCRKTLHCLRKASSCGKCRNGYTGGSGCTVRLNEICRQAERHRSRGGSTRLPPRLRQHPLGSLLSCFITPEPHSTVEPGEPHETFRESKSSERPKLSPETRGAGRRRSGRRLPRRRRSRWTTTGMRVLMLGYRATALRSLGGRMEVPASRQAPVAATPC